MKISGDKLKSLCEKKHLNLKQLLHEAGVSRNAYYSLLRKDSVFPKSVIAIANQLYVQPSAFLEEESLELQKAKSLLAKLEKIMKRYKRADRDNIRHTLLLLQEKPVNRLRRALLRAQKFDLQR
jgi:transcriptional regulator with XRE-family HTH domain